MLTPFFPGEVQTRRWSDFKNSQSLKTSRQRLQVVIHTDFNQPFNDDLQSGFKQNFYGGIKMKYKILKQKTWVFLVLFLLSTPASATFADYGVAGNYKGVNIVKPSNNWSVNSPVEVCMETFGVKPEPAKKGINENKGHHHLLIDVDLPSDLSKPIGKDKNHIHMGDGSSCKMIELSPGKHTITTLFAKGNHVPYNPPLSATITVNVR